MFSLWIMTGDEFSFFPWTDLPETSTITTTTLFPPKYHPHTHLHPPSPTLTSHTLHLPSIAHHPLSLHASYAPHPSLHWPDAMGVEVVVVSGGGGGGGRGDSCCPRLHAPLTHRMCKKKRKVTCSRGPVKSVKLSQWVSQCKGGERTDLRTCVDKKKSRMLSITWNASYALFVCFCV